MVTIQLKYLQTDLSPIQIAAMKSIFGQNVVIDDLTKFFDLLNKKSK